MVVNLFIFNSKARIMKGNQIYNLYRKYHTSAFIKISVTFAFLVCFDLIFGAVIKYLYFRQTSGPEFVTTVAIENTCAEVIILGSSHGSHHYHPGIFEEKLKMSCQNAGRDGFDIFYHYTVLRAILERYTPKIVLLDIDIEEFRKNQDSYDKLATLLPYYHKHPEIREIVDLKSKNEKFKMLSHIYPFNSTLAYILLGNTKFNQKRRNEINGYVPIMKLCDRSLNTGHVYNDYDMDPEKIRIYNAFIEDCRAANIRIYVLRSPYYELYDGVDKSIKLGNEIARKHNVPFYDLSNDTAFINHQELFADPSHLNNEGAKIYSAWIVENILEKSY